MKNEKIDQHGRMEFEYISDGQFKKEKIYLFLGD